jgi:hypothetical protein
MSGSSTTYNSMFAFGATGVENDRGGGYEHDDQYQGPSAVTMNGRTYHFIPKAGTASLTAFVA